MKKALLTAPDQPSPIIRGLARVLRAAGGLLPRPANLGPINTADALALAQQDEARTPVSLEVFRERPALEGKTLLDLGCGLGGKTAYYAAHGAKQVIGLEIDRSRAGIARQYLQKRGLTPRAFVVIGDAARLPLRRESMDLVMALDSWEHLLKPDRALVECLRVSTARGAICICFMPYYSPWGAHVWDWIAIPWVQLFLPHCWLVAIIREVDRVHRVNARRDVAVRINWYDDQDPAREHKLTVSRFTKSVRRPGVQPAQLSVLPIGFRAWRRLSRLIALFAALPGTRELLAGLVVCVLHPIRLHGPEEGA